LAIGDSAHIPISNTLGSWESGSAAAPTMVDEGAIAVALDAHLVCDPLQHVGIDALGIRRRPALDVGVRRERDRARRHRQARHCGSMMGNRLCEQVVEPAVIAALRRGSRDLEQRLGLGPADGLMLDGGRGQDARAPGRVIAIEVAGKMHAALGGRAFAGDHAVAHNGQRICGAITAGGLKDAEIVGSLKTRNRHSYTSQFLVLAQHVRAHVNGRLPVRNRRFLDFEMVAVWSAGFRLRGRRSR
jgi:hypothetical protein